MNKKTEEWLRQANENHYAKFITRYVLPTLVAAIIGLGLEVRSDIRTALDKLQLQGTAVDIVKFRTTYLENDVAELKRRLAELEKK